MKAKVLLIMLSISLVGNALDLPKKMFFVNPIDIA